MARINIEDCWWTDPRRSALARLIGDEYLADGIAVRMWRIAQEFWGKGRGLVPKKVFNAIEGASKLFEVHLAEDRSDGVYVCGSSQYLDWVIEQKEKQRAGGLKSAETRRKKFGSAQPKPSKRRSVTEVKPKSLEVSVSGSFSDSGSSSGFGSSSASLALAPQAPPVNPVTFYCDLWKAKNGKNPDIRPKEAGQITKLVKDVGHKRALEIMVTYFSMPDSQFMKRGYDVSTMLLNLAAISQFEASGKIVTNEFVKQVEKVVDKIQNTKRRRAIEDLEAEREAQQKLLVGGDS